MGYAGTAIYVDDVPGALAFYRRAFGLETRFFDEKRQFAELDTKASILAFASHDVGGMLMRGHHSRAEPSGVEVAFFYEDVAAAFQKVVEAGATPLWRIFAHRTGC